MPFKVDVQLPAHTLTNFLSFFSPPHLFRASFFLFSFFCPPGPSSGECPSKRSNTDEDDDDEDESDGGASQAAVRAAEEEEEEEGEERASGPGSSAEVR